MSQHLSNDIELLAVELSLPVLQVTQALVKLGLDLTKPSLGQDSTPTPKPSLHPAEIITSPNKGEVEDLIGSQPQPQPEEYPATQIQEAAEEHKLNDPFEDHQREVVIVDERSEVEGTQPAQAPIEIQEDGHSQACPVKNDSTPSGEDQVKEDGMGQETPIQADKNTSGSGDDEAEGSGESELLKKRGFFLDESHDGRRRNDEKDVPTEEVEKMTKMRKIEGGDPQKIVVQQ